MNFWDKNKDRIEEDVTSERKAVKPVPVVGTKRLANARAIAVERIEADPQHREEFEADALQRLANSLKSDGQLQPVRVRYDGGRDKFVIIAGERRWRAAQIADLKTVDCVVVEEQLSDSDILRQQILENALREDLKPTEQGRAFRDLMDKEGWTGTQLAAELNINQSTVSRMLGLLQLPAEVQEQVDRGERPIKDALKVTKKAAMEKKRPKGSKRAVKEQKISTSVGITVTLKARKILKEDQVAAALKEALMSLEQGRRAA